MASSIAGLRFANLALPRPYASLQSTTRVSETVCWTPVEVIVTGIVYEPAGVVWLGEGGGVLPPPPPEDEQAVRPAETMKTSASRAISVRRRWRRARGRNTTASTGGSPCHPPICAGRTAEELVWVVVSCRVTLPVVFPPTVVLGGLKMQPAYPGRDPHFRVKVAKDAVGFTRLNR